MRCAGLVALLFLVSGAAASGAALQTAQRDALRASGKVSDALLAAVEAGSRVRVIVSYREPSAASPGARDGVVHRAAMASRADAILATLSRDEFELRRRFVSLPALSGTLDLTGLLHLADDPLVQWVEPDFIGHGALVEAAPLTNTSQVQSLGYTGAGVRVAVIDTGIDTDHPALQAALDEERCFCSLSGGCCPNAQATQEGVGAAEDDEGHGTHVTGIVASNGTGAPTGTAPGVEIVAIKALDANNTFASSDVIAALDWINTQSASSNFVDIVNLSLETDTLFGAPCDPGIGGGGKSASWTNAVNALHAKGILVIAAAGNSGVGGSPTLGVGPAPACVLNSFSVAASYDADIGGPWPWGVCSDPTTAADAWACGTNAYDNTFAKTDLVAPGALITSTWPPDVRAPFTTAASMTGTSQAAPQVVGCAALVLEANAGDPTRTLADLEADLRDTPTSIVSTGARFGSSFPRLDCVTALPEPGAVLQSLALLVGLAVAARRCSPSRQAGRCASS